MGKSKGRQTGKNPAITQAALAASIKKSLADAREAGVSYACTTMKLFSYIVLGDKFGFTKDQLIKFKDELDKLADSLYDEYISVEDILNACIEDYDINLSLEELQAIDPYFDQFQQITKDEK